MFSIRIFGLEFYVCALENLRSSKMDSKKFRFELEAINCLILFNFII